jgi:hypothetical protein
MGSSSKDEAASSAEDAILQLLTELEKASMPTGPDLRPK